MDDETPEQFARRMVALCETIASPVPRMRTPQEIGGGYWTAVWEDEERRVARLAEAHAKAVRDAGERRGLALSGLCQRAGRRFRRSPLYGDEQTWDTNVNPGVLADVLDDVGVDPRVTACLRAGNEKLAVYVKGHLRCLWRVRKEATA